MDGEIRPFLQMGAVETDAFCASDNRGNELPPERLVLDHGVQASLEKRSDLRLISTGNYRGCAGTNRAESLREAFGNDFKVKAVNCLKRQSEASRQLRNLVWARREG